MKKTILALCSVAAIAVATAFLPEPKQTTLEDDLNALMGKVDILADAIIGGRSDEEIQQKVDDLEIFEAELDARYPQGLKAAIDAEDYIDPVFDCWLACYTQWKSCVKTNGIPRGAHNCSVVYKMCKTVCFIPID